MLMITNSYCFVGVISFFEEAIHGEPHRLCKYGKISLKNKIFFDKKCLIPTRWYQNQFLLKFGYMPIATS